MFERLNREKPKRPYVNFMEFVADGWGYWLGKRPVDSFPCLYCRAAGTIYDPDDRPCPVEGNKCRDRIKCPKCVGTGCGEKSECLKAYKEAVTNYKEKLRVWKEEMGVWNHLQAE